MIGIIDYKMGNVGSISNMLKKIGSKCFISDDLALLKSADKLILPGVGKFDMGVRNLRDAGLDVFLKDEVLEKGKNLLGICLGMQLLTEGSDEGKEKGLSFFKARTLSFPKLSANFNQRIPHMGWNTVKLAKDSSFVKDLPDPAKFYFVHSYFVQSYEPSDVLMNTSYGGTFCSALERNNIFGVQFHPEKSHTFGIQLLSNFVNL